MGRGFQFCSKTFQTNAICNSQDQLARVYGNDCKGGCPYCPEGKDCPLIRAWEPKNIKIVGVEVTIIGETDGLAYAYAGNGHHPNHMLFLGRKQAHGRQFFPDGLGFTLPTGGPVSHLTLHMSCTGKSLTSFYTLYYKPE